MLRDADYYQKEYVEAERSSYDIAEEHGTYPNKIIRELKGYGYQPRDRSEAQSLALKHGRQEHPTKGRVVSAEVRSKISKSINRKKDMKHGEQQ